jgi:uncharacterized protein
MNPSTTDPSSAAGSAVPPGPRIDVRGSSASSVIVHHVPAGAVDSFMEWQRGAVAAAESFPGCQGTDIYPPTDGQHKEWVVVIHFDEPEQLQRWLDSPVRAEWIARLPAPVANFQVKSLPAGFGPWFAGMVEDGQEGTPPAWKMAVMVLFGLYPTVMLIQLLVLPHVLALGRAGSVLVDNTVSVCLLQWLVMPPLQRFARPWLYPEADRGPAFSAGGFLLILLLLAVLVFLFRQVAG